MSNFDDKNNKIVPLNNWQGNAAAEEAQALHFASEEGLQAHLDWKEAQDYEDDQEANFEMLAQEQEQRLKDAKAYDQTYDERQAKLEAKPKSKPNQPQRRKGILKRALAAFTRG